MDTQTWVVAALSESCGDHNLTPGCGYTLDICPTATPLEDFNLFVLTITTGHVRLTNNIGKHVVTFIYVLVFDFISDARPTGEYGGENEVSSRIFEGGVGIGCPTGSQDAMLQNQRRSTVKDYVPTETKNEPDS